MARCHRIGQTKPVAVYRLCTKGTIDEEIIRRADAKRFLEKAVISKESALADSEEGLLRLKNLLETKTFKVLDPKQTGKYCLNKFSFLFHSKIKFFLFYFCLLNYFFLQCTQTRN